MKTAKILIVEDNIDIQNILNEILTQNNYKLTIAYSGTEALMHLEKTEFDMIILDLMLPGVNGESILDKIRKNSSVPVLIISAKDEVSLKSKLLKLGADDYITKPFDNDEVVARVITNLRRHNSYNDETKKLIYKDITLDKKSKKVNVGSKNLSLTNKEYQILELMLSNQNKVFSKANLFETIWNEEYVYDDNTINVHISKIRNKLKHINNNEEYIETIWGMGYRLL